MIHKSPLANKNFAETIASGQRTVLALETVTSLY